MKRAFLFFNILYFSLNTFSQAVQPSMMVFPSNAWCHRNGFERIETKANGKEVRIQEYAKAFIDNKDLGPSVHTIGKMMQERGFQLIDLESQLNSQEFENALDEAGDADIDMSAYDKLLNTAGPDIALKVDYYTEQQGPRVTLFYSLTAFDAYTNKQVASTGTVPYGPVMDTPLQRLIQSALLSSIDAFNAQLMQHFTTMSEQGREISVRINTANGWEDGLETEINGRELTDILEEWINNNSVAGRHHQKAATEKSMYYDSVRIPLYDENKKAIQANNWLKGLRKHLRALGVPCKVKSRGLGQAQLIIGE